MAKLTRVETQAAATEEGSGLDEVVVRIYRCATVVRGGRRFSFAAMVVVGDRRGRVGIGYGKSVEVPSAVEKGRQLASRNMVTVNLVNGTLPHRIVGRYGASKVVMVPASPGTGVIAGASARAVLELAGVTDVLTKSYGSNSPKNLVRATFEGLRHLLRRDQLEELRGVKVAG
ncbi:MAG TPA: 30S ribosomal protein S5 [Phycisphaerae bacterium]|nr:30S ribosomal protein S5 [Phycisphaerae bacterium]HNU44469.1 30S ribosomal protein S5 [Phycisphaerae bacterium]